MLFSFLTCLFGAHSHEATHSGPRPEATLLGRRICGLVPQQRLLLWHLFRAALASSRTNQPNPCRSPGESKRTQPAKAMAMDYGPPTLHSWKEENERNRWTSSPTNPANENERVDLDTLRSEPNHKKKVLVIWSTSKETSFISLSKYIYIYIFIYIYIYICMQGTLWVEIVPKGLKVPLSYIYIYIVYQLLGYGQRSKAQSGSKAPWKDKSRTT